MEWSGQQAFVSSSEKPFTVNGKKAGELKSNGPLSFLKVTNTSQFIFYKAVVEKIMASLLCQIHDAGHMVPMDQPLASLEMLRRWMKGDVADDAASESEGMASDM